MFLLFQKYLYRFISNYSSIYLKLNGIKMVHWMMYSYGSGRKKSLIGFLLLVERDIFEKLDNEFEISFRNIFWFQQKVVKWKSKWVTAILLEAQIFDIILVLKCRTLYFLFKKNNSSAFRLNCHNSKLLRFLITTKM